jgi:hypothetical protein
MCVLAGWLGIFIEMGSSSSSNRKGKKETKEKGHKNNKEESAIDVLCVYM